MTNDQTAANMSANPDLERIRAILREFLPVLVEQHQVKSLSVFGSYVRDEQQRHSDVDILVDFDETPSFFQIIELETQLSDALGLQVDLVMRDALRPAIRKNILRDELPV